MDVASGSSNLLHGNKQILSWWFGYIEVRNSEIRKLAELYRMFVKGNQEKNGGG